MAHVWHPCFLSLLIISSMISCSTARHTRALVHPDDGHASRDLDDLNHVFNDEKVTQTQPIITKANSHTNNVGKKTIIKGIDGTMAKESSKKEASEGSKVRRLIPRQRDMDEFVAYADYKGPMHHPPRNN
ncbi:hypothetical protein RND81_07G173000 [Saponaria officinalis]|uniref:Uncharacterized protein n=1 Tax=Saponaria officinalis TaxID=3572 RepID=A0AAW1JTQ3_SAPOF